MAPSISIALATYKGARFIAKQLDSLEAQTLKPLELIITDDQSPDETVAVAQDFASRASFPVKVSVNPERLGFAGNFMRAAAQCRGDLIAFCDQDDIWYPHKLATVVEHFQAPDVLLAEHAFDLIDDTDALTRQAASIPPRSVPPLGLPTTWNDGPGFAMVFRSRLMSFDDGWHNSVFKADRTTVAGHDQWIGWLAKSLGRTIFDPTPLAGYRQHGANAFGAHAAATERFKSLTDHGFALARFAECMERSQAFGHWDDKASRAVKANKQFARELMVQGRGNLGSVARLLLTGAYFRRRWPLGRRALLQDLDNALGLG